MYIQVELITPLGKFKSKRERIDDLEYEQSVKGLKQAVQGDVEAFTMLLADGGPDDDMLVLGKHVLINSVFRIVVEK
jgi:hypothetical protein